MHQGRTIFSQIIDFMPRYEFDKFVKKYDGNYRCRTFSSWDQFLCMIFAQLSYRESLRDIESCLKSQSGKFYHMGIKGNVARMNLARANERRDWCIFAEFAQTLIAQARPLYIDDSEFIAAIDGTVYALDSTTIDLCLSLFPWAEFRKKKGGVKLHTLLDLQGSIPTFIEITKALIHDVNILDLLIPENGAFYIMDRGYLDFERLFILHQAGSYFITRAKDNLKFIRVYSHKVDKSSGLRCDQTVRLTGYYSHQHYPVHFRRVKYFDAEQNKDLVFLTNNFKLSPMIISELYRNRWKVELFFKWIKQHLRIKSFYGTSQNAVKIRVWIAICTYLAVAIMKKQLKIEMSLYTILQILSVSLFEKISLYQLLTGTDYKNIPKVNTK
ncbi:MAG: IS4 family transposase, partial [Kosmotogaceae bacterium]